MDHTDPKIAHQALDRLERHFLSPQALPATAALDSAEAARKHLDILAWLETERPAREAAGRA